jgi:AAA domain-containing protein
MSAMRRPPEAMSWSNSDIQKRSERPVPWIWQGLVAADAVTLLTAPSKEGKSTLLSLLLDRRREGGMLLGQPVRPGRTVVCSEDNKLLWALRQRRLDFGANLEYWQPMGGVPTPRRWGRYIDYLVRTCDEGPIDLLVVDPLVRFVPGIEGHAACLAKVLDDLRLVAEEDRGILLMHHPQRHRPRAGDMVHDRVLAAYADILIDMRKVGGDPFTRRRRFLCTGRYPETPQRLLAELNAEGTDYQMLDDDAPEEASALEALCAVMRESPTPLTREEILGRWPAADAAPTAHTLWRWLNRGIQAGLLVRSGAGSKVEPFRYELAA